MKVVKKKKGTFPRILAGASAGAFLGLAAYLFLKSDKAAEQVSSKVNEDYDKHEKQERLFI